MKEKVSIRTKLLKKEKSDTPKVQERFVRVGNHFSHSVPNYYLCKVFKPLLAHLLMDTYDKIGYMSWPSALH